MSSPKFLVFKLKDLRIPFLIILVIIALVIFLFVKNKTAQTFAPSDTYQNGKYIAGITLSDAEMDLVVEIEDQAIVSVSLSGLEESSTNLYKDLLSGIDYINTYVTTTQSLELPTNANTSAATIMLMDAVKVALSDNEHASITSTYEKLNLTPEASATDNLEDDIFVDEFEDDIFVDEFEDDTYLEEENLESTAQTDLDVELTNQEVTEQTPDTTANVE